MKDKLSKEKVTLYLESLNTALKSDIEDIKNFDQSDIIYLEKEMLLNLRNLKKYDAKIIRTARKLDFLEEREERLSIQANYTRDSVIDNMDYEVKKSIAVIIVYAMISSNNFSEFVRKAIILLIIDSLTFNLNIAYFTSNRHKELIKKRLIKLRNSIRDEQFNYELYRGINRCFTTKLDIQYDKLLELYPEIDEEKIKVKRRK